MAQGDPLIQVKNVSKSFKTASGVVQVLNNVNFEILDGSFTIIYGPSGSGKSTLINSIIGLDAPTAGQVTYNGNDMYGMDQDERAFFRAATMGMVQQTNYWVKSLSVLENVALPLRFLGAPSEAALEGAKSSLRRIGMEQHAHKHPDVLSGGEQQRVAMARALVNNPAYIVVDEPTGNLDSKNGDALINLLHYLNKEINRTIVLVTHNLEYLSLGDKLLLIQDGALIEMKNDDIHKVTSNLLVEMQKRIDDWAHYGKR